MRTTAPAVGGQENLTRNEVRPVWWVVLWGIVAFGTAMLTLMFFYPDYAALWLFLLASGCCGAGMSYKVGKYAQPLPDDPIHRD